MVRRIRIIKKVQDSRGRWKFISLKRSGNRFVWDSRPGFYFLDWRDGTKRRREVAGSTPAEALEAQRRKRNELIGEAVTRDKVSILALFVTQEMSELINHGPSFLTPW